MASRPAAFIFQPGRAMPLVSKPDTIVLRLVHNGRTREYICRSRAEVESHLVRAWDQATVDTSAGRFELIEARWVRTNSPIERN